MKKESTNTTLTLKSKPMKKYVSLIAILLFLIPNKMIGQDPEGKKADVAIVLRGFDNSCFFCDAESYDPHAREFMKYLSNLSFGQVSTYVILEGGIDERSPIYLQSLRDIDVFQEALNGWTSPEWQWVLNLTDFWLVVPEEYRPVIEDAIAWMEENQLDFQSWGNSSAPGSEHYWLLQTNVQRMGSSAAADYLFEMKMPVGYSPKDYDITLIILHSEGQNHIAGGGAAHSLPFFGVQDSEGVSYTDYDPVAYVGATPHIWPMYSTAVHEAIHCYGMGTHDKDPNELTNYGSYSIMLNGALNTLNTLPAWDRYYWTKWLSQETITTDSLEVQDLFGKTEAGDEMHKYILEVIPGDELGRGGTYRELFKGEWYTYEIDAGGTLSFISEINHEHIGPENYILAVPETITEGTKEVFRAYSSGWSPLNYEWIKDGVLIQNSAANELLIDPVSMEDEGWYEVTISNGFGELQTDAIYVTVACAKPEAPVITLNDEGYLVSSTGINTWFLDGVEIATDVQMIMPELEGVYTVITTEMDCSSDPSEGYIFVISEVISLEDKEAIKLYPNPFQDRIILDFELTKSQHLELEIYDLNGAKIYSKQDLHTKQSIDLSHLTFGVYRAHLIVPGSGLSFNMMLVKME
ncbi:MAG: hypothetical protein ACJA1A_001945 [Saprospiraceae bacterium]